MITGKKSEIFAKYSPEWKSRWKSYVSYKLIIWAWLMSEIAIVFAPTDISHSGYYIHGVLYIISIIFIGIPLVYSEICIFQYTNCDAISIWDFFPLLRGVGYGSIFLVILKSMYIMVLTSWYLEYAFYSAFDPPPWFTCDDFNDNKCMVKRINVSIFQHCLETESLFADDCGMKTASNCFFEREIGNNNSSIWPKCVYPWKSIAACISISFALFFLCIRKEKYLQVAAKFTAMFITLVIFVLFCVALSTSGSWYATKIVINWKNYNINNCFYSITRGFLSLGTGYGIIGFISSDAPFRSPANMTAIATPLFSAFVTLTYALIAFSGIKTMSYYHGEEENVIEIGDNIFFSKFASMSEIMSYFDAIPVWGFMWFSSVFLCLLVNLWILYFYLLQVLIENCNFARQRTNFCSLLLILFICLGSLPFFCSDLTSALSDATTVIQLVSSLLFSITLYWIYGQKKHNIDIIFMIGVKASYYWKITWLLNPMLLSVILYTKLVNLDTKEYVDSHEIVFLSTNSNVLLFYAFVGTYVFIILLSMILSIITFYRYDNFRNIFVPTDYWGPRDKILNKSRKMFVPEIMTREFLYRQVRIHGYFKKKERYKKEELEIESLDSSNEKMEWSVLTSN